MKERDKQNTPNTELGNSLKIITIEDKNEEKILRTPSREVTQNKIMSEDFQDFLDLLLKTAQRSEEQVGVASAGISAPQVGKNVKVFYILNNETGKFEIFINPQIIIKDFTMDILEEGCLSVPNRMENIQRYKKIEIEYLDREGRKQKKMLTNMEAREAQHENDHLEGILFIDKIARIEE